MARKYAPGREILKGKTSKGWAGKVELAGQQLRGQMILEVPIQKWGVPQKVLEAAAKKKILIRDVAGKVY